jgi:hypothetical protein
MRFAFPDESKDSFLRQLTIFFNDIRCIVFCPVSVGRYEWMLFTQEHQQIDNLAFGQGYPQQISQMQVIGVPQRLFCIYSIGGDECLVMSTPPSL